MKQAGAARINVTVVLGGLRVAWGLGECTASGSGLGVPGAPLLHGAEAPLDALETDPVHEYRLLPTRISRVIGTTRAAWLFGAPPHSLDPNGAGTGGMPFRQARPRRSLLCATLLGAGTIR